MRCASLGLLRAYASILFSTNPWVGGVFFMATMIYPNAGISGLLAAITGLVAAQLLRFPNIESGLHTYNSLLVGLSLGIVYHLDGYLLTLIVLGSFLAVFLTVALADILWRLEHLPALSLPFVVVALTTAFAAQSYGTLSRYMAASAPVDVLITPAVDGFLSALGSAFFTPHPVAGLLLFLGLLWTSRYLALLAVLGYVVGFGMYSVLSNNPYEYVVDWSGFNYILTAVAIGGIFTVPCKRGLILALTAAGLAALVTTAVQNVMLVYGLPVMALPFLLTTMTVLVALRKRISNQYPTLILESPALPEQSSERKRLSQYRLGDPDSTALAAPFMGSWQVYQGFNGPHTHQPPWQHALDFHIVEADMAYRGKGQKLDDYYCFGLPVLAPAAGEVVAVEDKLPDNAIGNVDTANNWGNHIVIALPGGVYLLLAHLKHKSIEISVGMPVWPGLKLAACGNSGRSPQPHLHMHVQTSAALGSPTCAFHLTGVSSLDEQQRQQYWLVHRPEEGDSVRRTPHDKALARTLDLPVGKAMRYQYTVNDKPSQICELDVRLNLYGEFYLCSDSGAQVYFKQGDGVLAFYNRNNVADPLLDVWLLALGLTPFSEGSLVWQDSPPIGLLPQSRAQRLLQVIRWPMSRGLDSHYQRNRQGASWIQKSTHQLGKIKLHCEATLQTNRGCTSLQLEAQNFHIRAQLETLGQTADRGVPAWQENL